MQKISFYIFIVALIFAPLAFGSVETWSVMIMELLIALSAFFYSLHLVLNRKPFYSVPGLFPLIILCEFVLFQVIPLPEVIVKAFSPSSWELYNNTAGVFGDISFMSISVNKAETVSEFVRIIAYTVFYAASVQILSDRYRIRSTLKILSVLGFLLAFSSICQFFLREDYALWFRYVPANSMIFGPYICHNHYAGLMEMIFPPALALFVYYRPSLAYGTIREKIIDCFSNPGMMVSFKYLVFALTIAVSVFLSLSRGGIIGLAAGTGIFFLAYSNRKSSGKSSGILRAAVLIFLIILSVTWFGWEDIAGRFSDIKNIELEGTGYSRLSIWKDTFPLIRDFFITGSGFGTFKWIFPSHQSFSGSRLVDHAHNDYLEFASNGGILSVILIFFFLLSIFRSARINYIRRRDRLPVLVFIASMSAVVSILVHSFFDFNMQIPANALYFFLVCSLLVAGSAVKIKDTRDSQTLLEKKTSFSSWSLLIASLATIIAVIAVHGTKLRAENIFSDISHITVDKSTDQETLEALYSTAIESHLVNPFEPDYSFACATLMFLSEKNDKASDFYLKAIRSNPADTKILLKAASFFVVNGENEKADRLMSASIRYMIAGFEEHRAYAEYLYANRRITEAIDIIRKIFSFYNGDMKKFIGYVASYYKLGINDFFDILPDREYCWRAFGEYAAIIKDIDAAEKAFMKSTECYDADSGSFLSSARFFIKNDRNGSALQILKKAGERFPDDTGIMEMTAGIYESQGVSYRAMEEYRKILIVDPGNLKARSRLDLN